jgi:hypothetical protein
MLSTLLCRFWNIPLELTNNSTELLFKSWNALVKNKSLRLKHPESRLEEIESTEHEYKELETNEAFEKRMYAFLSVLIPKLPCPFNQVFQTANNSEVYFEYFSYFLHLIQRGALLYEKSTKIVSLGKNLTYRSESHE